ncbi:MAG TPA: DUF4160 domain-containing protein [Candidatus Ozemobacteraceae bacterium]|nr:DUF4160 domain-containing protein [Candidatus Ozemobacteraceae bacterium]
MPIVFRYEGYRFFFFSNEGIPREPLHIHVRRGDSLAKIWLDPEVVLAESWGFSPSEQKLIMLLAEEKREMIRGFWNEYFAH